MKKDLIFTGAGTALVTPFTSAGEIAWEELDRLVEFQLENKIDAIIACGTTGEAATMTGEEHLEVIDFIIKKVAGRVPVIAGTGSNDTAFCVELSLEAKELGADVFCWSPPTTTRPLRRAWWRASTSSPTR